MAAGQLWLFDPPKPLVERLGEDFFRALPPKSFVFGLARVRPRHTCRVCARARRPGESYRSGQLLRCSKQLRIEKGGTIYQPRELGRRLIFRNDPYVIFLPASSTHIYHIGTVILQIIL